MRRLLIAFSVIVLFGVVFGYMILRPVPLFSQMLQIGDTEDRGEGRYIIKLYDKSGEDIIHITFDIRRIVSTGKSLTTVRIQIGCSIKMEHNYIK